MSHYTVTIGFEADSLAEATEISQEIIKATGKVIRSFDRYMGNELTNEDDFYTPENQDTNAAKEFSPEERIDIISKIIDIYEN